MSHVEKGADHMARIPARRTATVVAIAMVFALFAQPSSAGSRWDPNDSDGRIDFRWMGVVPVGHHTLRVTMTFWGPVGVAVMSGARTGIDLYMLGRQDYTGVIHGDGTKIRVWILDSEGHKVYGGRVFQPDRWTLRFFAPRLHAERIRAHAEESVEGVYFEDNVPDKGSILI